MTRPRPIGPSSAVNTAGESREAPQCNRICSQDANNVFKYSRYVLVSWNGEEVDEVAEAVALVGSTSDRMDARSAVRKRSSSRNISRMSADEEERFELKELLKYEATTLGNTVAAWPMNATEAVRSSSTFDGRRALPSPT